MSNFENRVHKLEKGAGGHGPEGPLEVTDPRTLALLHQIVESIGGPAAERIRDEPLPCSEEEWRAAKAWVAKRKARSRKQELADATRTAADPNAHPLLVRIAESIIADDERKNPSPGQAEEARERAMTRTVH
jgi:hypothetical protein